MDEKISGHLLATFVDAFLVALVHALVDTPVVALVKLFGHAPEMAQQHETCKVWIILSDAYMQSRG